MLLPAQGFLEFSIFLLDKLILGSMLSTLSARKKILVSSRYLMNNETRYKSIIWIFQVQRLI